MFVPSQQVRIWLCTQPADMRKSYNGLSALVKNQLNHDPLSGHYFVFNYPDTGGVLALIAKLYQIESELEERKISGGKKRDHRLAHSKPIVDALYQLCETLLQRSDLTPQNPLAKALKYTLGREQALRVFLEDPDVPLDTNHLERTLRPIPMGRKNSLFCWTEIGAEHVGIIQSSISTCKLHDLNPYTYLTDVLLRISEHPVSRVAELTPRVWKERFADKPLGSDLYTAVKNVVE
jgi:transposase